jgi:hypothetical protein
MDALVPGLAWATADEQATVARMTNRARFVILFVGGDLCRRIFVSPLSVGRTIYAGLRSRRASSASAKSSGVSRPSAPFHATCVAGAESARRWWQTANRRVEHLAQIVLAGGKRLRGPELGARSVGSPQATRVARREKVSSLRSEASARFQPFPRRGVALGARSVTIVWVVCVAPVGS